MNKDLVAQILGIIKPKPDTRLLDALNLMKALQNQPIKNDAGDIVPDLTHQNIWQNSHLAQQIDQSFRGSTENMPTWEPNMENSNPASKDGNIFLAPYRSQVELPPKGRLQ